MPSTKPLPLYMKLVRQFPLRPLRSDADLEQAIPIAEALDFRPDLAPEERDYLEALAILIERYEDEHHLIPDVAGADMLRGLIEFRGTSAAEVARATGIAEPILSELVRGKRKLGRRTIATLARYFHVNPGVFLATHK